MKYMIAIFAPILVITGVITACGSDGYTNVPDVRNNDGGWITVISPSGEAWECYIAEYNASPVMHCEVVSR